MENLCSEGTISELYFHALIDMTKRVIENLSRKYVQVQKGVSDVMGGKVLDYEAKTIFRQGIAKGREEGITSLINFAKSVNASVEQILQALMKEYQLSQEDALKYIQKYWK